MPSTSSEISRLRREWREANPTPEALRMLPDARSMAEAGDRRLMDSLALPRADDPETGFEHRASLVRCRRTGHAEGARAGVSRPGEVARAIRLADTHREWGTATESNGLPVAPHLISSLYRWTAAPYALNSVHIELLFRELRPMELPSALRGVFGELGFMELPSTTTFAATFGI